MSKVIEVLTDKTDVVERTLAIVLGQLQSAIQTRGTATLVLSGGSTPKPLYELLAQEPLPWDKIQIFWGDERYVPADHPDSNERMAREAWLNHVPIPPDHIHPMPTDEADPQVAAQRYESTLRQVFHLEGDGFPRFDLVLLGMGDDGHTASLFPHTPALQVCDRLVTVGQKDGQPRITLTVPVLNQARCVVFMVVGANKQSALAQVFAKEGDASQYPSRLIRPQDGELIWLLDREAGANL